ncbi:hypothetical protein L226DRAFT_531954 [Lentinus tigrinus ALCF2SS1-7]|uniref:uncharacterized protein n=1 Tax=Lentinus tigrinus ALCF2SS1-7 TaxID=1328758 RepID=UPI001165E0D4|nr:hypothetical protein L226DRAFT_531954 [Lentinus tigrinus ALCF2SS1-7]
MYLPRSSCVCIVVCQFPLAIRRYTRCLPSEVVSTFHIWHELARSLLPLTAVPMYFCSLHTLHIGCVSSEQISCDLR